MVPGTVPDRSVLENARAFLSWLVTRAETAREDAEREWAREERAILRGTVDTSATVPLPYPDVEVGHVFVLCRRLLERLEPGHAVHLRVDGKLLGGVYSTGGAQQKRQELDAAWHEKMARRKRDKASAAGGSGGRAGCRGGRRGGGGRGRNAAARPPAVEVVPWEASGRLLLACPFTINLPVLRYFGGFLPCSG